MVQINHRCAVLGSPIAHSLSPVLHMAAYQALGLNDWAYERHEVTEQDLNGFLNGLDSTWRGLSLTMPLKRTIQPYGTPADAWVASLHVANTAVFDWNNAGNDSPRIRLYNTDVPGIMYAFQHAFALSGQSLEDAVITKAVVIGNGNTAASAVSAVSTICGACTDSHERGTITVAARHPGKNPDLARIVADDDSADFHEIELNQIIEELRGADIVVSTIPGHAADVIAEAIATDDSFFPRGTLLDVVYDPRPSALIRAWRAKGGNAIGGEEMLLYQAILQVQLMTGEEGKAALGGRDLMETLESPMRRALEEAL